MLANLGRPRRLRAGLVKPGRRSPAATVVPAILPAACALLPFFLDTKSGAVQSGRPGPGHANDEMRPDGCSPPWPRCCSSRYCGAGAKARGRHNNALRAGASPSPTFHLTSPPSLGYTRGHHNPGETTWAVASGVRVAAARLRSHRMPCHCGLRNDDRRSRLYPAPPPRRTRPQHILRVSVLPCP